MSKMNVKVGSSVDQSIKLCAFDEKVLAAAASVVGGAFLVGEVVERAEGEKEAAENNAINFRYYHDVLTRAFALDWRFCVKRGSFDFLPLDCN
jgi:hypothetical protein